MKEDKLRDKSPSVFHIGNAKEIVIQKLDQDKASPDSEQKEKRTFQVLTDEYYKVKVDRNLVVQVVRGNITNEKVDAIAIPANGRLRLKSGLAKAIVQLGGNEITDSAKKYITARGTVETGECAVTNAGTLPVKHIIHTVGPTYDYADLEGYQAHMSLFFKAVKNTLQIADS